MIIPVHQTQLFKYPCPSPVTFPNFAVAINSPFFFTTKLDPMNSPLPTARQIPTILNAGLELVSTRPAAEDDEAAAEALRDAEREVEDDIVNQVPWMGD